MTCLSARDYRNLTSLFSRELSRKISCLLSRLFASLYRDLPARLCISRLSSLDELTCERLTATRWLVDRAKR